MVGVVRPSEPLLPFEEEEEHDRRHRQLGGSGDDNGYLVDADGNGYESYSLAWRYLGMFIDSCDNNNGRNRHLEDAYYSCRKVLWAAYHDPGYKGGGIAEYQFYNKNDGSWDGRTCRAQTWWPLSRCQHLNCHEAGTNFELVGVFKETDGLYDFTEQLFKHQGYCLWDADKNEDGSGDSADGDDDESSSDYNFMQTVAESWVGGCSELENIVDADGNALYYDTKPLPAGNITYGVYTDAYCLTESEDLTWSDVLAAGEGDDDGISSDASLDRWNDLLSDYKICQPCRAYNRVRTGEGGSHDSSDGSGDSGDYEDGDDGEGGKERHGFDCYDAAGYRNCNQCYKFQTQTDMEPASVDDLERATEQGTILAISVDGTKYGQGHFAAPHQARRVVKKTSFVLLSVIALAGLGFFGYKYYRKKHRRVRNADLKGGLTADYDEEDDGIFITGASLREKLRSFLFGDDDDREKLKELVREKDAKLSQQEQLIQQLQQKLDSYEPKQTKGNESKKTKGTLV